jgi:hypothetical protein
MCWKNECAVVTVPVAEDTEDAVLESATSFSASYFLPCSAFSSTCGFLEDRSLMRWVNAHSLVHTLSLTHTLGLEQENAHLKHVRSANVHMNTNTYMHRHTHAHIWMINSHTRVMHNM